LTINSWSKLNGDENSTWGPDALLTPTGEGQAHEIAAAWDAQGAAGAPLPTAFYVSPLTRAVDTLTLTFGDRASAPVVLEGLRETNGVHTCDKRRPKTWIAERTSRLVFERGFTEEDELWDADVRETDDEQQARIRAALLKIIDNDESICACMLFGGGAPLLIMAPDISITAHSGTVAAALRAIGHRPFTLPTGGVLFSTRR
jgi:broad specificity phosphatase PhoE